MKKIIIVILLFVIIISSNGVKKNFSLLNYFDGEYSSYTNHMINEKSINLGFCYMQKEVATNGVIGESLKLNNFEIGDALKKLNAKVIKTEYIENGKIVIYAYSNLINSNVRVENKLVNLQIVHNDETTIIGWPLILGSY